MGDERDRMLRVYLNRSRTDKIPKDASQEEWREFHRHWGSCELTARQLAIEVYHGYSVAHLHDGRKTKKHWREAWYVALDFDTEDEKSTLDYLARQDLIWTFASFAHTTPSHTEEAPRARVFWIFEEPITDYEQYLMLYKALLAEFPWADQSTKDAARFFFGCKGCKVWTNWSIFPKEARAFIVGRYKDSLPKPKVKRTITLQGTGNYSKYVKAAVEQECGAILTAQDGDRHLARFAAAANVGELVGATWAGLSKADALDKLVDTAMKNTKTPRADIERVIADGIEQGMSNPRPEPVREYQVATAEDIL